MSDQLRTIRLYGVLGARFGRVHRLAVKSTAEAMRALGVVLPGFRRYMAHAHERGLTFAVFVGKQNLTRDELDYPVGGDEIRIAPILIGSKSGGLFQTILGVAIAAVGVVFEMPTLIGLGASMALGGVVQMLSPQTGGLSGVTDSSGTSYYFNGPVNSAAQGDPVPVVYGHMAVGSKVISSGIYAQDQN